MAAYKSIPMTRTAIPVVREHSRDEDGDPSRTRLAAGVHCFRGRLPYRYARGVTRRSVHTARVPNSIRTASVVIPVALCWSRDLIASGAED